MRTWTWGYAMKRSLSCVFLAALVTVLVTPVLANAGAPPSWPPMIASQRFIWQSPLPQGNPINKVDFVSDTLGWAVGDNGTVLKTTDGGFSWTSYGPIVQQGASDRKTGVYDVCFVDAEHGWIAADTMVYRTNDGGVTWSETGAWTVSTSGSYMTYQDIDFVDANNGWFLGNYWMFHTTDGGSTVTTQALPADMAPYMLDAISSAHALAYAYYTPGYAATSDGGATWHARYFTGTAHEADGPYSMAAANSSTIYASVDGDLLKTTNGGSTWTTVTVTSMDPGDSHYRVYLVNGDSGSIVYAHTDGGDLHRSPDGGTAWVKVYDHLSAANLDMPSGSAVFGVHNANSRVIGSSDSGSTWRDCYGPGTSSTFSALDFTSETTGHAITNTEYTRTIDGGATWSLSTAESLGIDMMLTDMTFLETQPDTGWIVGTPPGGSGLPSVYKTVNGGAQWLSMDETAMVAARRVTFADADNGWVADSYGKLWHSTDGGNSWAKVAHPAHTVWDIEFYDAAHGWLTYNPSDGTTLCVSHTTDGGSTWTTQTVANLGGGALLGVDFVDQSTGYAFDQFSNVYKTTDSGSTWTDVEFTPYAATFRIEGMRFTTALDGWVVGNQYTSTVSPSWRHDFAAHTTDGGETWDFYDDAADSDYGSTGTHVSLSLVDSFGDETWLAGAAGAILKYRHRPLATITSSSKSLAAYGDTTVVTGTVTFDGAPLADSRVDIWTSTSADGDYIKSSLTGTTTASGQFSITVKPSNATYYRVKSPGSASVRSSSLSGYVKVTAAPSVGTPRAPSKMKRLKYYTVYGYLKPRHTKGSYPVLIYKWRKTSSGSWKSYGSVKAKAYDYKSGSTSITKYSVKMRLTKSGKWRLRALHPADALHIKKWSTGYDYVTVP